MLSSCSQAGACTCGHPAHYPRQLRASSYRRQPKQYRHAPCRLSSRPWSLLVNGAQNDAAQIEVDQEKGAATGRNCEDGTPKSTRPYWAYTVLMCMSALLGGLMLLQPVATLRAIGLEEVMPINKALVRVLGGTYVINGIVEYCLQDAVKRDVLRISTAQTSYQALLLSAAARQLGVLLTVGCNSSATPLALLAALGTPTLLALSVHLAVYYTTYGVMLPPAEALLWRRPSGPVSAGYLLLVGVYVWKAGSWLAPGGLLHDGRASVDLVLQQCAAPGFALAGLVALVLRQCKDEGRLTSQMSKTLNLGIAGVELTYRTVVAGAIVQGLAAPDIISYGNIALSVSIALFCASQYFIGR